MTSIEKKFWKFMGAATGFIIIVNVWIFTSFTAKASEMENSITVQAFMFSQHLDGTADELNQSHDLLGLEYDDWFFQTYVNSHYERTYAVGHYDRHVYNFTDKFSFGYSLSIIEGYSRLNDGNPIPVIMPMLSYKFDSGYGIDVLCVPDPEKLGQLIVCAIQGTYTFGGN